MYLAFDPGETTGWAEFNDEGECKAYGQLSFDELIAKCEDWRGTPELKTVIIEEFVVFNHKARKFAGSRMKTSQAIGIIKSMAHANGAKVVEQPANIKPIAQKWTQIKPPSDHSQSHWVDAFNHGAYYLIKQNIRKTYLEEEMESKRAN